MGDIDEVDENELVSAADLEVSEQAVPAEANARDEQDNGAPSADLGAGEQPVSVDEAVADGEQDDVPAEGEADVAEVAKPRSTAN